MQLPAKLQLKIENLLEGVSLKLLKQAAETLSIGYRSGKKQILLSKEQQMAYLIVRMPATYAVLIQVLQEWNERFPSSGIQTALDVGAGPGTGGWALHEIFPQLKKVTLLEKDVSFVQLGKKIMAGEEIFSHVEWWETEAMQIQNWREYDLVIASFSLGEMKTDDLLKIVTKMWNAAKKGLLMVEPGTPEGFDRIRKIRDHLIQQGAFLMAPCPHAKPCPMQKPDWCHFSARVERSSWHRQLKGAEMNYEDEKFSYVMFSKDPINRVEMRILSRPEKKSGYVRLKLCTDSGIIYKNIPKSAHKKYREARQSNWGEEFRCQ